MLYRIRQFIHALAPQALTAEERAWTQKVLPEQAWLIFHNQDLTEQYHALAVAKDLAQHPSFTLLSDRERKNLLIAALLHDCGKACSPLSLWQRVFIVLAQKTPAKFRTRLERSVPMLALPLYIAAKHADWGADAVSKAGLAYDIVRLIRFHHNPKATDEKLLCEADSRN